MNRTVTIVLRVLFIIGIVIAENSTQSAIQFDRNNCPSPSLTLNGTPVAARRNTDFNHSALTEVKFTAQLPIIARKYKNRLCKIKCIAGVWVGPLCQEINEDNGHFHPILRNCKLHLNGTNLMLLHENTQLKEWNGWLPDRSEITLRCNGEPGLLKFFGHSNLKCMNGEWNHEMPSCIPTTQMAGFSANSPPTIVIKLPIGNSAMDYEQNQIVIYPGSIIHLECLFYRKYGEVKWTWTTEQRHHLTGWAMAADEREYIYRMSLYYVKIEDSGNYTCIAPNQETNTISLKIKAVQCEKRDRHRIKHLVSKTQGYNVGQTVSYSCPHGFVLRGINQSSCLANSKWSSEVPYCEEIICSSFRISDKWLINYGNNITYGSVIKFHCQRGYVLKGAQQMQCRIDGHWSSPIPSCADVLCTPPIVPLHGYLIEETSRGNYNAGTIVQFACNKRYQLIGKETITCQENGTWSESSPYCISTCEYPGQPINGRTVPQKFWYETGDHLKIICDPGYTLSEFLSIVCKNDGSWSANIPPCVNYTDV